MPNPLNDPGSRTATAQALSVSRALPSCSPMLAASPAFAQAKDPAGDNADQIVLTGRLVVTADETVDAAVIFNGPALVEGTVRDALVVLNGDAEVTGTVRQDVVVLNGDLVVRSGAEVGGDLVTQSSPTVEEGATVRGEQKSVATEFNIDEVGFGGRVVWWIGYSVSVLILGLLLLVFAPQLFPAVRETAAHSVGLVDRMGRWGSSSCCRSGRCSSSSRWSASRSASPCCSRWRSSTPSATWSRRWRWGT